MKRRSKSTFANYKNLTIQKKPKLVKLSRVISIEGPGEDMGLHLGWAYTARSALNMREVITKLEFGWRTGGCKEELMNRGTLGCWLHRRIVLPRDKL